AAPAAGHQPSFTFPTNQCSSQSQCASQPRAALAAGFDHSCAVASNGNVSCWGNNASNKLGVASGASYAKAQVLSGLSNARAVTAGLEHGCAVTSAGALYCWGDNTYGQLGTGNNTAATTATAVPSLTTGVASVVAGAHHTCALLTTGAVKCFGRNDKGQLGDTTLVDRNAPVTPLAAHAKVLTASGGHTCAYTDDGATRDVKCWGDNVSGQLGVAAATLAPDTWSATPRSVSAVPGGELPNIRALVAGGGNATVAPAAPLYFGHTCALLASGEAVCWGANGHGQLGGGTTGGSTDGTGVTPLSAAATTLTNIASLSAGERFTCALKTDRSTVCWGQNGFGQFGDDTTTDSAYATPAFGLGGAVSLVAGAQHACVLRWGGNVECSGKGTAGQLGDNSTLSSDLPVGVLTQAEAVFGAQWQRCEAITVSTP
ncbi:MAG: hypothetical protein IOD12_09815, partial [Silvanigrellales bacterium]|nr:hypothetical protein [Silvanigrellales bacterium]